MATVEFEHIKKNYGGVEAISDFNLHIEDGEFCVFVGPSGCGKSTALKMLAGLEATSGGTIQIGGRDVTELGPGKRDIAMVFQNYALYPHMSVRKNIGFGLKMAGMPADDINSRVEEAARVLELTPYLDRKPRALSGGQRQRVALGRAIVREPKAFLMDEPLSNLDAKLRVQTRSEIVKLQKRLGVTTIYVTHDQTEALTMADKIVVMRGGLIQQIGSAEDLFHSPKNIFVAGFIGSPGMNFFHGRVETGARGPVTRFGGQEIALPDHCASVVGRDMVFGIRPEHIRVGDSGPHVGLSLVENLGTEKILHFHTPGENVLELDRTVMANDEERDAQTMLIRVIDDHRYNDGDTLSLAFPVDKIHVFHPDTHEVAR
ncbi:sn-glycerol-3-phosphate ABC transporter ATP-binding protein UgpC [Marinovum sp. 2_MG-2023]|uniref:ABC transporter ATP-binding protein n=1 Tax=unclassified Marinovum TaxID=2647166 RepID=UPI0026E3B562|nr:MULTISPECIES: sn-glycerol-3-phosphate ABC transporter ATP-binding protein UgpC [unclassified Marinovum]MDO6732040.1 sn-glycerol-3-phosphate ABC transporter ATP-binding protein UgpC [Marinovum sp. 2_MG-2023]MDO6781292.1 sn-glycerol-3-phosphate ABC transporter ATP-binding protein UgpC [Marinovum sp. 1_MG-2023]